MEPPERDIGPKGSSRQPAQSVADTIAFYKEKCFHGEFKSAEQILITVPDDYFVDPKFVSEIARMQIRQGAYSSAARVLDHVLKYERGEPDKLEWVLLEIQRVYVAIYMEGTLKESVERSAYVWRQHFEEQEFSSITDTMVSLSLFLT